MNAKDGCKVLLEKCANVKKGENILVITDNSSFEIGKIMYESAMEYSETTLICMKDGETHGSQPNSIVGAAMQTSDVIFSATTFSLFNTPERIKACNSGARFINMADYSMSMLESGSLFIDFEETKKLVDEVSSKITGEECLIETKSGTSLNAKISGRRAVNGYGIADKAGMASSPPDIETAVGPIEGSSNGKLIIDGSIPLPGLGKIKNPIEILVKDGYIRSISGGNEAEILKNSLKSLNDDRVYLIGEIGFGMNKGASITGRMLEDEGVFGTIHIGIGNNLSYGGKNNTPIHIDLIMEDPTYSVDGKIIYKDGKLV